MTDNIYTAIASVMAKVPYLKKTDSKELGYTYASEAELIRVLHPAMVEAGLTLHPFESKLIDNEVQKTNSGKSMRRVLLHVRYKLTHVPTKEVEYVEAFGESWDSSDKATSKAMTMAQKYALRQLFLIETGDRDPDADRPEAPECKWSDKFLGQLEQIPTLTEEKLQKWVKAAHDPQAKLTPEEKEELLTRVNKRLAAIAKQVVTA